MSVIVAEKMKEQNSIKPVPSKWEIVWTSEDKALSTHRMKTTTGWIVLYMDMILKNSALVYVPDPFHEWICELPVSQGN